MHSKGFSIFVQHIHHVLDNSEMSEDGISHLFLVGGFAESPIVQEAVRQEFRGRLRVIIPQVIFLSSFHRPDLTFCGCGELGWVLLAEVGQVLTSP